MTSPIRREPARRKRDSRATTAKSPRRANEISCPSAKEVYAIEVPSHRVFAKVKGGHFSNGVTLHPNGKRVHVSNGNDATVLVIDTEFNRKTKGIPVGVRPWGVVIR